MKKSREQFTYVTVKEWFEERDDGIYMIWEFKDKTRMERLTPYKEIPVIEKNWWRDK